MRKSIIKLYNFAKNVHISAQKTVLIVFIVSFAVGLGIWNYSRKMVFPVAEINYENLRRMKKPEEGPKKHPKPGPVSIDKMKKQGCVADGLLSGYGGKTKESIDLINRSNCLYLHRAIETWANPPDFKLADKLMWDIKKPGMVYGMFIAEAIRKNAKYYYDDKHRYFDFSKMCRGHSDNRWGEHTCIPSLKKEEYRDYIKFITRKAMDLGVQSFLFGQIYLQDTAGDREHSEIYDIVKDMREYAREIGITIVVGAQTNSITDERYLRTFDYIEGGVGINAEGNIENGPCFSGKGSCWALLWNDAYAKKANNVFLHLDWSGIYYDDMSIFARMDKTTREKTLKNLYSYFTSKNMGFMMPYLAVIHKQNGGCHGPKKRFYSPDNKYTCQDEDAIASIMAQNQ